MTCGLEVRCSIQLSYVGVWVILQHRRAEVSGWGWRAGIRGWGRGPGGWGRALLHRFQFLPALVEFFDAGLVVGHLVADLLVACSVGDDFRVGGEAV